MESETNEWDNGAPMADMRGPAEVEVKVIRHGDELRLWVNVDGRCRLRAYGIDPEVYHYVEDINGRA